VAAKSNHLALTLLVAVVGGLASSVFVQWYQTWHEEKVWRREQHVRELQESLDRALQGNIAMEEMFATVVKFQRAWDSDEKVRSDAREWITDMKHAERERKAGRPYSPPSDRHFAFTERASEVEGERRVQEAKLVMLLHEAEMPDVGSEPPNPDPMPLPAFKTWSEAAIEFLHAHMTASQAKSEGRANVAEIKRVRDEAASNETAAEDKLRYAVRLLCTRAASRLHMFRKYGEGLTGDRDPPDPRPPWL